MRVLLGILMFLGGIALGLYVGVWLCFVGGLVDIIDGVANIISHEPYTALGIVWGIVKVMCAGLFGWLSAIILILPSIAMIGISPKVKIKRK